MKILERGLSICMVLALSTLVWTVAQADEWNETTNGGGDAGNFPAGDFQTTDDATVFDVITGNMDAAADPDRDSFLITVTDPATFSVITEDAGFVGETDTRLWLWDTNGMLLMANDDNPDVPDPNLPFLASLADPSTWTGPLLDNPASVTTGTEYILTIGGFSTDPEDAIATDLASISNASGLGFDTLAGLNPASDGMFSAWETFTTGGGDYRIVLTGAEFGSAKGGGGCMNALGDVNGDGAVDILDVAPFVAAITGAFVCEADVNEDGVVDILDVNPFVALITGG